MILHKDELEGMVELSTIPYKIASAKFRAASDIAMLINQLALANRSANSKISIAEIMTAVESGEYSTLEQ